MLPVSPNTLDETHRALIDTFLRFYTQHKFSPLLDQLTDYLLEQSLSARGYNNYQCSADSGERFFISRILAPTSPQVCIDVGAHIGSYVSELLAHTGAHIIAFEPLPASFYQLQENTRPHSHRLTLVNKGVGAVNGVAVLHYSDKETMHASFAETVKQVSYVSNEQRTTVPVVTLDSYCSMNDIRRIDLLKIDTEGYEGEVLEGAVQVIRKTQPQFIQIEFNWHQLFQKMTLYQLSQYLPGYRVYQLLPNRWVERDVASPFSNLYQFSNFVFARQ